MCLMGRETMYEGPLCWAWFVCSGNNQQGAYFGYCGYLSNVILRTSANVPLSIR
jgi:hypothetical protein